MVRVLLRADHGWCAEAISCHLLGAPEEGGERVRLHPRAEPYTGSPFRWRHAVWHLLVQLIRPTGGACHVPHAADGRILCEEPGADQPRVGQVEGFGTGACHAWPEPRAYRQ